MLATMRVVMSSEQAVAAASLSENIQGQFSFASILFIHSPRFNEQND